MREEIYDYLHEYGFKAIEIDRIENRNDNMFFTSIGEVRKNITFLQEKGLEKEEIIKLVNYNPFMLTEKNNRLEALDKIYYEDLKLSNEELKELIKNNGYAYIISPIEFNKILDYFRNRNYSIEIIKKFIFDNPSDWQD